MLCGGVGACVEATWHGCCMAGPLYVCARVYVSVSVSVSVYVYVGVGAVLQARAGSLGPLMSAVAADLGRTLDAAAVRAVRPHVTEAACDRGGTWQRRHVAEAARDSGRM